MKKLAWIWKCFWGKKYKIIETNNLKDNEILIYHYKIYVKGGNVMAKVFTSKQFIEKCKWLVYDVPNYYHSENGTFCNYNWNNGKFMMDCVVSIKGLLWGFRADKNAPHGGAIYGSNGVADFGANDGINYCTEASQNFNNLVPGEYLCMRGTNHSHAGVYLGNGKVFECTAGWDVWKCIISDINSKGERFYNGVKGLSWTWHGKLKYIDYSDTPAPTPTTKFNVGDKVRVETCKPYKYYVADDVQKIYGIYQVREDLNAGGASLFSWRDNGIPEGCLDKVDANGNKTADSDRVHLRKGDKFVFAKTFTIKAKTVDFGKNYVKLSYTSNPDYDFWVVTDYLKKV